MNLLDRFRWWCAQKLINAECARLADVVREHEALWKSLLDSQRQQIWWQGYAQGQRDLLKPFLSEHNGKELSN